MTEQKDPRVFFAAERTLLAWTRTSIAFLGFGVLIERFGMFVKMTLGTQAEILNRSFAFWLGLAFILCGVGIAVMSSIQYGRFLKTLNPGEIPDRYWPGMGLLNNLIIITIGIVVIVLFLVRSEPSYISVIH
jgi:putative membrane protein